MFIILFIMMTSWVYTYAKLKIFKYVQLIIHQLHLNKARERRFAKM